MTLGALLAENHPKIQDASLSLDVEDSVMRRVALNPCWTWIPMKELAENRLKTLDDADYGRMWVHRE